jgi:hypothetical protein
MDVVEGLVIRGGRHVDILTAISLHGSLCAAWQEQAVLATTVVSALAEHWRAADSPRYVQFDNDGRFQGSRRVPRSVGRVTRICMSLGVVVVFAPPREHGPQSQIESFNGLRQRRVWRRFEHANLEELQSRSSAWVLAHRARHALGSSRRRRDGASPKASSATCRRSRGAGWSTCAGPTATAARRSSSGSSKWTAAGRTA